jgi:peptidoglycan/xylan/chitin deacetylase (PgdA/CDA1 family)
MERDKLRRSMTTSSGLTRRGMLAALSGSVLAAQHERPRATVVMGRPKLAVTMDDLNWAAIPEPMRTEAGEKILAALDRAKIKAGLFVIGQYGDTPEGRAIVQQWNDRGHMIGNHTWSHRRIDAVPPEEFGSDILRCDTFVRKFQTFRPYFRFPVLKEGDTRERRDWARDFLAMHGYKNGAVTIDTSDWYYDQRLRKCIQERQNFDVSQFREPYLAHLWDRAKFYNRLSHGALGRPIPHTILLHYNLLNSLFLGDALDMFTMRGWDLADAEVVFQDKIFDEKPDIVPAGESLVWALAKATRRYGSALRYPGEDDVYEKPKLDKLGL